MKRQASNSSWDDVVSAAVYAMLQDVMERVGQADPVGGQWVVPKGSAVRVWCDASSIALGVRLDVDGVVVEDGSWLRKADDSSHINVAELEAAMKGVNLALKWGAKRLEIMTDSATTFGWISSVIRDTKCPKVSGLCEMLVRRRLAVLAELQEAYNLDLSVTKVSSAQNLSDSLTRVPQKWLHMVKPAAAVACASASGLGEKEPPTVEEIQRIHEAHHLGIERTLYVAREVLGEGVTEEAVRDVISTCSPCSRIDPAPVKWDSGTLAVEGIWERVAADVTHYKGQAYLTLVDCGPSRFAVWRMLTSESAASVGAQLDSVFCDRGAPRELVTDNGPCFRSSILLELLKGWGVFHHFSCAYRPTGNAIVERNHRTIKRMAARVGCTSLQRMVYWYNATPNKSGVVPIHEISNYVTRVRGSPVEESLACVPTEPVYGVGDHVYVRPHDARCVSEWPIGRVTGVCTPVSFEVNGIPRHVRDLRHVVSDVSTRDVSAGKGALMSRTRTGGFLGGVRRMFSPQDSDGSVSGDSDDGGADLSDDVLAPGGADLSDDVLVPVVAEDLPHISPRVRRRPTRLDDYVC